MGKKESDSDTSIYLQDINFQKNDNKALYDACLVIILGKEENKKINLFNEKESIEPIKEVNNTIKIGRENIVNERRHLKGTPGHPLQYALRADEVDAVFR